MTRYAEGTTVSVDSSQSELQRILRKRGADKVVTGWDAREVHDYLLKGVAALATKAKIRKGAK